MNLRWKRFDSGALADEPKKKDPAPGGGGGMLDMMLDVGFRPAPPGSNERGRAAPRGRIPARADSGPALRHALPPAVLSASSSRSAASSEMSAPHP